MFVLQKTEYAILHENRILMSGIGSSELPCRDFQNAEPDRYEHFRLIVGTDRFIGLGERFRSRFSKHRTALQNDLGSHHEQSRRDTLSGYIGHDDAQMVVIDQEDIIEVSSHFSGGIHRGIDVKLFSIRKRREDMGNHTDLDLFCRIKLVFDPFLFHFFFLFLFQDTDLTLNDPSVDRIQNQYGIDSENGINTRIFKERLFFHDRNR